MKNSLQKTKIQTRVSAPWLKAGIEGTLRLEYLPPRGTGLGYFTRKRISIPGTTNLKGIAPGRVRFFITAPGCGILSDLLEIEAHGSNVFDFNLEKGLDYQVRIPPGEIEEVLLDNIPIDFRLGRGKDSLEISQVPDDGERHLLSIRFKDGRRGELFLGSIDESRGTMTPVVYSTAYRLYFLLRNEAGSPSPGTEFLCAGRMTTPVGSIPWIFPGKTNESGIGKLKVPGIPGPVAFMFLENGCIKGMAMASLPASKKSIDLGEFVLPLGATLQGRVQGLGKEDIAKATAKLAPAPGCPFPFDFLRRETPLSSDGWFVFLGVAKGNYLLQLAIPGMVGRQRPMRMGVEKRKETIYFKEGREIQGTVLFGNGDPAPNTEVSIKPTRKTLLGTKVWTDSQGMFKVRGALKGTYRISAVYEKDGRLWSARKFIEFTGRETIKIVLFKEP